MKKIYCVRFDRDFGEIWLDEEMNFLDYIHSNDATWQGEYHGFIIKYFGGELIELCPDLSDKDYDKMYELDGGESYWDLIKSKVIKQLKKAK